MLRYRPTVYSFKDLLAYMLKVIGRRRMLMSLPFGLARLQDRLLQHLPNPPLTADQVELLQCDNVVAADAPGLADLGIQPTPLEVVAPRYLMAHVRTGSRQPYA